MLIYRFSGTETGFYSVVYEIYTKRMPPDMITSDAEFQFILDATTVYVNDSDENAAKVRRSIVKSIGLYGVDQIGHVLRSCEEDRAMIAFRYVHTVLKHKRNAVSMKADRSVAEFDDIAKRVAYEIHRMHGFIRFSEMSNGIFYACFEPDNDITDCLMPYFASRLNDEKFIIHDKRRGRLGLYNGKECAVTECKGTFSPVLCENEEMFLKLWRDYFKNVSIESRKNPRLQLGYLPRRYRKHMPETYGS